MMKYANFSVLVPKLASQFHRNSFSGIPRVRFGELMKVKINRPSPTTEKKINGEYDVIDCEDVMHDSRQACPREMAAQAGEPDVWPGSGKLLEW